tara:strand:- start:230 stop:3268 length:3039 start_codon:yes stop_codon:yes gene_type:complete
MDKESDLFIKPKKVIKKRRTKAETIARAKELGIDTTQKKLGELIRQAERTAKLGKPKRARRTKEQMKGVAKKPAPKTTRKRRTKAELKARAKELGINPNAVKLPQKIRNAEQKLKSGKETRRRLTKKGAERARDTIRKEKKYDKDFKPRRTKAQIKEAQEAAGIDMSLSARERIKKLQQVEGRAGGVRVNTDKEYRLEGQAERAAQENRTGVYRGGGRERGGRGYWNRGRSRRTIENPRPERQPIQDICIRRVKILEITLREIPGYEDIWLPKIQEVFGKSSRFWKKLDIFGIAYKDYKCFLDYARAMSRVGRNYNSESEMMRRRNEYDLETGAGARTLARQIRQFDAAGEEAIETFLTDNNYGSKDDYIARLRRSILRGYEGASVGNSETPFAAGKLSLEEWEKSDGSRLPLNTIGGEYTSAPGLRNFVKDGDIIVNYYSGLGFVSGGRTRRSSYYSQRSEDIVVEGDLIIDLVGGFLGMEYRDSIAGEKKRVSQLPLHYDALTIGQPLTKEIIVGKGTERFTSAKGALMVDLLNAWSAFKQVDWKLVPKALMKKIEGEYLTSKKEAGKPRKKLTKEEAIERLRASEVMTIKTTTREKITTKKFLNPFTNTKETEAYIYLPKDDLNSFDDGVSKVYDAMDNLLGGLTGVSRDAPTIDPNYMSFTQRENMIRTLPGYRFWLNDDLDDDEERGQVMEFLNARELEEDGQPTTYLVAPPNLERVAVLQGEDKNPIWIYKRKIQRKTIRGVEDWGGINRKLTHHPWSQVDGFYNQDLGMSVNVGKSNRPPDLYFAYMAFKGVKDGTNVDFTKPLGLVRPKLRGNGTQRRQGAISSRGASKTKNAEYLDIYEFVPMDALRPQFYKQKELVFNEEQKSFDSDERRTGKIDPAKGRWMLEALLPEPVKPFYFTEPRGGESDEDYMKKVAATWAAVEPGLGNLPNQLPTYKFWINENSDDSRWQLFGKVQYARTTMVWKDSGLPMKEGFTYFRDRFYISVWGDDVEDGDLPEDLFLEER